jgi:hypothetical protein
VRGERRINIVAYGWTYLILINVNLVQQDATIQDTRIMVLNPISGINIYIGTNKSYVWSSGRYM